MDTMHQSPRFKCTKCSFETSTQNELIYHMGTMHQSPRFKCTKCSFESSTQNELIYHMDTNHQPPMMKCVKCPQSFEHSEALVAHLVQSHTEYNQQERPRNTLDNGMWNCSFCGEKFTGNEARDRHRCNSQPASPVTQQVRNINKSQEPCRRGVNCHFHKVGSCWFSYVINVENTGQSQVTSPRTGRRDMWCAFQDKCTKRPTCVYKHMDEQRDFVQNLIRGMGA